MLVNTTGKFLVKRLLLLEARYENLKKFLQCRHCQILSAVIVNGHLFHFRVLFDELTLLGLKGCFSGAFLLFGGLVFGVLLLLGVPAIALGIRTPTRIVFYAGFIIHKTAIVVFILLNFLVLKQVSTVLAQVVSQDEWLASLHRVEHLDGVADILDPKR